MFWDRSAGSVPPRRRGVPSGGRLAQQVPTAAGGRCAPPAAEICITEQVHRGERISGLRLPPPPTRPAAPAPAAAAAAAGAAQSQTERPDRRAAESWERRRVFAVTAARLPVKCRTAGSADAALRVGVISRRRTNGGNFRARRRARKAKRAAGARLPRPLACGTTGGMRRTRKRRAAPRRDGLEM